MLSVVVRFLSARLQPADLIALGNALAAAGRAAQQKQAAIADALSHVQHGLSKLTQ